MLRTVAFTSLPPSKNYAATVKGIKYEFPLVQIINGEKSSPSTRRQTGLPLYLCPSMEENSISTTRNNLPECVQLVSGNS
jgi:hypothetical protein